MIHSCRAGLGGWLAGTDERTGALFSYVDLDARVRKEHPLRTIRAVVNEALGAMEREIASLYPGTGRPSIAPERLLRAILLQAFYSIRSERQLMERIEFDLLFRWFVGFGMEDPVWDHSTFSKNRNRPLEGAVAARFLSAILAQPRVKRLLSSDHFSVDGTLVEAWASMKSFRPKDGPDDPAPPEGGRNPDGDFRGEKRSNATHASTTDPDAKLYRKGTGMEAKLCFMGHALMENRSGLLVDTCLTQAGSQAERVAALAMIEPRAERSRPVTLGADRGFEAADFVNELRTLNVRPHVAQNTTRRSAVDGRTTRHPGYAASQRIRKRIEEAFGWMKSVGGMRRPMLRGLPRMGFAIVTAYEFPQARETSPVSQKFTDRVLPSQSEPTVQIALYAPAGVSMTAQGHSLWVKLDDRCAAQTWPNISSGCVVDGNGAPISKPVRTITFEERTGPNSSALVRKPALQSEAR